MPRFSRVPAALLLALLALLCATAATAQGPGEGPGPDTWEYMLTPYLWVAGLDGELTVRGISVDVNASFGDIVENLEIALPLHFEARKKRWALLADLFFLDLQQDIDPAGILPAAEVDVDTLFAELLGAYRVSESAEVIFGGRYTDYDVGIQFFGPAGFQIDGGRDWLDPIVGFRLGWASPGSGVVFLLRGDVGGFGVGSELTWNLHAYIAANISRKVSAGIGYRILDTDFEEGSGTDLFRYDIQQSGVDIGFTFHF